MKGEEFSVPEPLSRTPAFLSFPDAE